LPVSVLREEMNLSLHEFHPMKFVLPLTIRIKR